MDIIQLHNAQYSQMMGYILVTDEKEILVIDGGTTNEAPEFCRIIRKLGGHIALWVITHPHYDHYGVLRVLTEHPDPDIRADRVLWSAAPQPYTLPDWELQDNLTQWQSIVDHAVYPMQEVACGDRFSVGNTQIEILRTAATAGHAGDINHLSMVLAVTDNSGPAPFRMLFLGDLGEPGGEELLEAWKNCPDVLKADAVQMAHHGQGGVGLPVYQAIAPRYAFWPTPQWLWDNICNGAPGPWETLKVRKWMEALGAEPVTAMGRSICFHTRTGTWEPLPEADESR